MLPLAHPPIDEYSFTSLELVSDFGHRQDEDLLLHRGNDMAEPSTITVQGAFQDLGMGILNTLVY